MGISDGMFTGDLARRLAEVERQLRNLTSGRRLEDASIGARGLRLLNGGSLTIAGGSLIMHDETGSIGLLYFGPSANGRPIWAFSFDDGELAGGLFGPPGGTYWSWRDRGGHEILGADGLSGVGLSRPHLNYRLVPSEEAQVSGTSFVPSHDSTSFVPFWEGINPVFHPRVTLGILPNQIGGTAHWRLLIDGTDVSGDRTGAGAETFDIPGWGDSIVPGDAIGFEVQGYIDGGTRAFLQVDRFHADQS